MRDRTLVLVSLATGAFFAAVPVIQRLVLLPLWLQHGYSPLVYISRISSMILLPGKVLVYRVWPPQEHYFVTLQLLVASAFNLLVYFTLALVLLAGYRRIQEIARQAESATSPTDDTAPAPDRRAFLATAATGTAGLMFIATGTWSTLLEPDWLKVRRLTINIPDLPAGLRGMTVLQMSDIHHDEWVSAQHIRKAVQLANSLEPDLVVLTGDYVTSNSSLIRPAVSELARLKSRVGVLAVMGNHDWWSDADETRRQFVAAGIPLIDNDRRFLTADRQLTTDMPSAGICVGGVGDLWEDAVEPETAFRNVPADMPRLLLSHNPDVAEQGSVAAGKHRIDLMLSGHTHGGQVRLPGMGTPVIPSAYGQKYSYGLVNGPACLVNVSSGIGMALLPVRFNVRPEVVLLTLERG